VKYQAAVRATTMLASALRTTKPDCSRQLRPVNRVEPSIFTTDRHQRFSRLAMLASHLGPVANLEIVL